MYIIMTTNIIQSAVNVIKDSSPNMKDSTISTYTRQLKKLFEEVSKAGGAMLIKDGLPSFLYDVPFTLNFIQNSAWGETLKPTTRKHTLSLILTMFRRDTECSEYKDYRKIFEIIKEQQDKQLELQLPKNEAEEELKDIKMEELSRNLNYHFNKVRKSKSEDVESAQKYFLGHLHLDQVLRNEACSMMLTEDYITVEEDPNANFIWLKGRNMKLMVIRNNKVRNPARGDEPKEVYLKGVVNSALNKYVQTLKNSGKIIETWSQYPLVYTEGGSCSSSHYSQLFKTIWAHMGLELTTTQLRKVYAMDIREKYKGNLVKENEACLKLDHSKDTHDKHYILDFT